MCTLTWIFSHRWMWMQLFHPNTQALYLFSSATSASNNKYSVSSEAARLISIQQIFDHRSEKIASLEECKFFPCHSLMFSFYTSNLTDAKKTKCHTPGKNIKSLFPACVNLLLYKIEWIVSAKHFLMTEQNRNRLLVPLICLFEREPCSLCNPKCNNCDMIFGQYGMK